MSRFLSSKNTFTIAILWFLVLTLLALLYLGITAVSVSIVPIIVISLVISLISWVLLDTRYVIKNGLLLYRSGPFRGRVDINKIHKIKSFSGLNPPVTMKPALDSTGFIITYNTFDDVYVSPKNANLFVTELLKINPNIVVE